MLVCHCHVVTDREIRRLAEQGARTVEDVRRACKAGSTCAGCVPQVRLILRGVHRAEEVPPERTAQAC